MGRAQGAPFLAFFARSGALSDGTLSTLRSDSLLPPRPITDAYRSNLSACIGAKTAPCPILWTPNQAALYGIPMPAAPRFVVFEAWAFLLPSLGDFLGCTRSLLPFSPGGWAVPKFSTDLFPPNVHVTVTEIFIPSILRA